MTIIKHSNQRVGVLIDAQNLYHSAQNLYGKRVNFTEVLEEAVAGRQLIRAIAYVITSDTGDESSFFEALENAGIETKTKDLQIFHGGAKKADWDVGIAMDAVKLSTSLDAIVIASGDGDFIPMVKYVQQHAGCQVEVISFGRSSSSKLMEVVDDFTDMCDDTNRYLMGSRIARSHNKRKRQNNSSRKPTQGRSTAPKAPVKTDTSTKASTAELLPPVTKDRKEDKKQPAKKATTKKAPTAKKQPAKRVVKKTTKKVEK